MLAVSGAAAAPIFGGQASQDAYKGWLGVWRETYQDNDGTVPELKDAQLPAAFAGIKSKVVISSGGAAGGVVTEGMGYAIMVEGFEASAGNAEGLANGLSLMKGWLGMVYGPNKTSHPFGGGSETADSATKVDTWPYGVSAIESAQAGLAPSGVAAWKFPITQCSGDCQGTATDGDEDAVLGMIYLASALGFPEDFADVVVRAVISFASADLGFPDLYRTMKDGTRVFIPRGGSQWGGLMPETGTFKSTQAPWCYNPSYFAPGHYRLFSDFATTHWKTAFDAYLPAKLDGSKTSVAELGDAFDGTVIGGYNMLYHSSCSSGAVANWVGAKAECPNTDDLSCAGVPWATTPYIGASGTCSASGTTFGQYGPDASRTPWRIALDYILYSEGKVSMYTTAGELDSSLTFNSQVYLNRFVQQYKAHAQCDGGKVDGCVENGKVAAYKLAPAFSGSTPGLTCDNVPNAPQDWWAAFMSYPTFTTFVAPAPTINASESSEWMDTFASLCDFSSGKPTGDLCATGYFEAGQEVIASMIMSGRVKPQQHLVMSQPGSSQLDLVIV